ncbi:MAG: rRNA methyltransferase [Robiginitomaculum sp.]|nr:MAG: rRNA methyltransferase [Robiginitomaculum sp.]
MDETENKPAKTRKNVRAKANAIKPFRCKNLIVVLENPRNLKNIGTTIRNIDALGAEKTYIVDSHNLLKDDWEEMRKTKSLLKLSASAIKWSFVKRFESTQSCLAHLHKKGFVNAVTSPHIKGRTNVVLHEGDYTHAKLAVWFGTEGRGISDLAVEQSEMCINIPMYGMIESLNLGTTTGIVLYEITKQRRAYQEKYKRAGKKRPIEQS